MCQSRCPQCGHTVTIPCYFMGSGDSGACLVIDNYDCCRPGEGTFDLEALLSTPECIEENKRCRDFFITPPSLKCAYCGWPKATALHPTEACWPHFKKAILAKLEALECSSVNYEKLLQVQQALDPK